MTPPLLACLRQDGQVVADLDHDTYGNPEVSVETVKQPFRFTGREFDTETGLYYYRARMYDSNSGRFMQEDPIWLAAGDHNFFRYVFNNPVRYRDPSGESVAVEYACMSAFASAVGTAGGVASGTGLVGVFYKINATLHGLISGSAGEALAQRAAEDGLQNIYDIATGSSFAAGTLIATKDGPKPVEELAVGTLVPAIAPNTGVVSLQRILSLTSRYAQNGAIKLTLEVVDTAALLDGRTSLGGPRPASEIVTVTANHPYLMEDGKWRTAGALSVGDRIRSAGGPLVVKGVSKDDAPLRVYNLEVETDHTYAAGKLDAWVHNTPIKPPTPAVPGSPFSPGEVDKRKSAWRVHFGIDPDPDRETPSACPGVKKGSNRTPHKPGQKNIGAGGEEHSRRPKGGPKGGQVGGR